MKRLLLGTFCLLLGSACGPSTVNQDACTSYVDHLNALECRTDDVSVDGTCSTDFDADDAYNCTEYFECLTAAATCDGDTFVNTAVSSCTSCEVPE